LIDENDKLPIGIGNIWQDYYDKNGIPLCDHIWQKYEGFTERYEFCIKCDEKRQLSEDTNEENAGTNFKRSF
jgi:hypothetical protein